MVFIDKEDYTIFIFKEYIWWPRKIGGRWKWLEWRYVRYVVPHEANIYVGQIFDGYLTDEEVLIHLLTRS